MGIRMAVGDASPLPTALNAIKVPGVLRAPYQQYLPLWRAELTKVGLILSLMSLIRLEQALADPDSTVGRLIEIIDELQIRIRDELHETSLWQVSRENLGFFEPDLFKLAEQNKFGSAHRNIEDAGKCLAFNRGTAAVFHLMRVMEYGLRALGESLNDPSLDPKRNPSWDAILKKCDDELRKPLRERSAEWREDEPFYSNATANLRAVKNAWRNPTLHVERDYDPDDALDVWNAVKAFMRHLAKKLSA